MSECCDSEGHPLPGDRGWSPGIFTELRVHGVGNTALDRLLDDPHSRQVAGDEVAGFYRSRCSKPMVLDPGPSDDPPAENEDCMDGDWERLTPLERDDADWRKDLKWTDVEAYDWGGFNTGGGWKAMWLFLIPFTLANVAGWMVAGRSKLGQKWARVFALGISLLFVTWLGAVVIDLVALRCGWQPACYDRQFWLVPFNWGAFASPSGRMAFALLIPLAATFVLWWLPGRKSQLRYEQATPEAVAAVQNAVPAADLPDPEAGVAPSLRNPNIWARESEVRLDASLHGAAILAALGGCVAWANWAVAGEWYDRLLVVAGGILLFLALLMTWGWTPFAGPDPTVSDTRRTQVRWVGWLSVVFMVLIIATSFVGRGYASANWAEASASTTAADLAVENPRGFLADAAKVADEAEQLSGSIRNALFTVNGVILIGSLAVLIWVVRFRTSRDVARRNRRLWGRWAPVAALLAGLAISASLMAGAGLWLEEWLGDRPSEHLEALGIDKGDCANQPTCDLVSSRALEDLDAVQQRLRQLIVESDDVKLLPLLAYTAQTAQTRGDLITQPVISLPEVYDLAAVGFLAMVIVVLGLYGALELRLRMSIRRDGFPVRRALCELAAERLAGRTPEERKAWAKVGVRELRKSPRNTRLHHLAWPLVAFMVAYGVFLFWDGLDLRLEMTEIAVEWIQATWSPAFTFARWVATGAIAVVATLVYRSYKPAAQESFGGMWDVISFLPRHYHPFAVPSYGERAVPELAQRIKYLCDVGADARGGCLVSAHSGGVVISVAAIALLDERVRRKVSLLTYGSPTGALYGRAYPEYFDTERLINDVAYLLGSRGTGPEPPPGKPKPPPGSIRWYNLWRLTDWTGGYMFGPSRDRFKEHRCNDRIAPPETMFPDEIAHIERIQYDPACRTLREGQAFDPVAVAIGHTDYLHDPKHVGAEDPRYQSARTALADMLP